MLSALIFGVVGLFIGWFFLPSPQWAKNLMVLLATKFPVLAPFVQSGTTTPTPTPSP